MKKEIVLSGEEPNVLRFVLVDGIALSEMFEKMYAPDHVDKLTLRVQRQYFRQKLTELNWGGVISDLRI